MITEIFKLFNDFNHEEYAGFVAFENEKVVAAQDCRVICNSPYNGTERRCASCDPTFGGHPSFSRYIDANGIVTHDKRHFSSYTKEERKKHSYLSPCFDLRTGEDRCHWSYDASKFSRDEIFNNFFVVEKDLTDPYSYGFWNAATGQ